MTARPQLSHSHVDNDGQALPAAAGYLLPSPQGNDPRAGARQTFATIVADPPWPIKDTGDRTMSDKGFWAGRLDGASKVPYRTLSIEEIKALPVASMAESDAHLYLWAINQFLEDAYDVARAWGFRPATLLTWCKAPRGIGFGGTFTGTTEFVLFARRGSLAAMRRWDRSHFDWKRPYEGGYPAHSKKPDGLQDVVMETSPGPYLELFARSQRLGWSTWGNECLNHIGAVAPAAKEYNEKVSERG